MVAYSTRPKPQKIKQEVRKDFEFWLPLIAGVATKEEIELATAHELAVYCEVSNMKIELMKGGI